MNIGYHGMPVENAQSLACGNTVFNGKLSVTKNLECLRFLADCGICIDGIDINEKKQKYISFYDAFNSSIYKSVASILSIGGVIVIFSVFSNFFDAILISASEYFSLSAQHSDIIHSVSVGILEIANGCSVAASSSLPTDIKLIIINFLISFSGISVIFQTLAVTNDFNFNIGNYIFYRAIQGITSVIICIGMLIIT